MGEIFAVQPEPQGGPVIPRIPCPLCQERQASPVICPECAWHTRRDLLALPELYVWLELTLPAGGGRRGEPVTGSATPGGPIRLDVLDQQQDILAIVGSWARAVAEDRGEALPEWRLVPVVGWLADRHAWITSQPWADEYAREIRTLARRARGLTGVGSGRRILPGRCPRCDGRPVATVPGEERVECSSCRTRWTPDEYLARLEVRSA